MDTLPAGITAAEIERYAKLDVAIKRAQVEHKALNDKIKKAFTSLGTFIVGNVIIKRTTANGFDAKAAAEMYPFEKFPAYYAVVPSFDKSKVPDSVLAEFATTTERLSVDVAS